MDEERKTERGKRMDAVEATHSTKCDEGGRYESLNTIPLHYSFSVAQDGLGSGGGEAGGGEMRLRSREMLR